MHHDLDLVEPDADARPLPAGTPNSSCASITSSPLFISVDESTEIFGPIVHVGCANASSIVTLASSSRDRPRNGPPDAVSTMRATRAGLSFARRHMCTAQCSESTGTSSAPGVTRARCTTGPAAISDSLFANASRRPANNVAKVTDNPAKPTTPFTTTSASSANDANAWPPARTSHAGNAAVTRATRPGSSSATATTFGRCRSACAINSCSCRPDAPNATSSKCCGPSRSAASTSRDCVPIEPVEPAIATRTALPLIAPAPRRSRGSRGEIGTGALLHQLDALLRVVRVLALVLEQRLAILLGFTGG